MTTNNFLGATNSDFNTDSNWSLGHKPTNTENAKGTNKTITLSANAGCYDYEFSGCNINGNGHTLTSVTIGMDSIHSGGSVQDTVLNSAHVLSVDSTPMSGVTVNAPDYLDLESMNTCGCTLNSAQIIVNGDSAHSCTDTIMNATSRWHGDSQDFSGCTINASNPDAIFCGFANCDASGGDTVTTYWTCTDNSGNTNFDAF